MSDISKCKGNNCYLKEKCYRYTSNESYWQSWFINVPFKNGKCEYYLKNENHENS